MTPWPIPAMPSRRRIRRGWRRLPISMGCGPAPLAATMRVLELGCGRGGNLIPMAAQYPGRPFVGIDLSPGDRAGAPSATELGLGNLAFEHRDILAVTRRSGPSTTSSSMASIPGCRMPVRERIIGALRELLAPQGVAYVSYNALPGCRLRDLARDVMLFETRDVEDPQERVRLARAAQGDRRGQRSRSPSWRGAADAAEADRRDARQRPLS
jgi:SAM-dependent methyltransferase